MKFVIAIILTIIIYRQFGSSLNLLKSFVNVPTQLGVFAGVCLLISRFYNSFTNYRILRNVRTFIPQMNYFQPIELEPVTIMIEQRIIRIPLEDRVDLNFEDNHNVHNKTIKRTAVMSIDSLKESDRKIYSVDSAIDEITGLIESKPYDLPITTLSSAKQALDLINEMDSLYCTANTKEKEIIRLVWERINHPINATIIDQLKENLIKEISDCKKGQSSVHCCEGRVTRVLQSLQSCDVENIVDLRPMWAFKEEIENKISKYREKLFKKAPKKYSDTENKLKLTEEDRKLIDKFNACLLKNLSHRFDIDYIKTGYLTKDELSDITEVYYESLYDY